MAKSTRRAFSWNGIFLSDIKEGSSEAEIPQAMEANHPKVPNNNSKHRNSHFKGIIRMKKANPTAQTQEISTVEMSPAEENTFPSGGSRKATYALVVLKFLELCLMICCIGLIDEPATHSHIRIFVTPRIVGLCYVTFGCLLIYTSIYLIMAMFGDATPWKTGTVWSFVGFCLVFACTALLFRDWANTKDRNYWQPNMQRLDLVLGTASVALVAAVIFLIDLLVTIRFGSRGDLD